VRALTADRKTTTVTDPTIATQIHQPFDVHRDFAPKVTLDLKISLDYVTNPADLRLLQIVGALVERDPSPTQYLF
jgi:hypothetical protein